MICMIKIGYSDDISKIIFRKENSSGRRIITLPALWGDDPTGLGQRGGLSTAV